MYSEAKLGRKTHGNLFYKNSILHPFYVLEAPFRQKRSKSLYPNVNLRKDIFLRFVNRCSMSNYPYMFNTRAGGHLCPIFRPHGVCALCTVHFHPFSSQYVFSVVLFIPVKDHLRKIASRQFAQMYL